MEDARKVMLGEEAHFDKKCKYAEDQIGMVVITYFGEMDEARCDRCRGENK